MRRQVDGLEVDMTEYEYGTIAYKLFNDQKHGEICQANWTTSQDILSINNTGREKYERKIIQNL